MSIQPLPSLGRPLINSKILSEKPVQRASRGISDANGLCFGGGAKKPFRSLLAAAVAAIPLTLGVAGCSLPESDGMKNAFQREVDHIEHVNAMVRSVAISDNPKEQEKTLKDVIELTPGSAITQVNPKSEYFIHDLQRKAVGQIPSVKDTEAQERLLISASRHVHLQEGVIDAIQNIGVSKISKSTRERIFATIQTLPAQEDPFEHVKAAIKSVSLIGDAKRQETILKDVFERPPGTPITSIYYKNEWMIHDLQRLAIGQIPKVTDRQIQEGLLLTASRQKHLQSGVLDQVEKMGPNAISAPARQAIFEAIQAPTP